MGDDIATLLVSGDATMCALTFARVKRAKDEWLSNQTYWVNPGRTTNTLPLGPIRTQLTSVRWNSGVQIGWSTAGHLYMLGSISWHLSS